MPARSCSPPSCSQLIVCSTDTCEATRVTFIDQGLEFKYPLKHQSVNSLWDEDQDLTGWPGFTSQRPFINIGQRASIAPFDNDRV